MNGRLILGLACWLIGAHGAWAAGWERPLLSNWIDAETGDAIGLVIEGGMTASGFGACGSVLSAAIAPWWRSEEPEAPALRADESRDFPFGLSMRPSRAGGLDTRLTLGRSNRFWAEAELAQTLGGGVDLALRRRVGASDMATIWRSRSSSVDREAPIARASSLRIGVCAFGIRAQGRIDDGVWTLDGGDEPLLVAPLAGLAPIPLPSPDETSLEPPLPMHEPGGWNPIPEGGRSWLLAAEAALVLALGGAVLRRSRAQ